MLKTLISWFFPLHFYQTNVAAAVVGSAVVGGAVSAYGASEAADAQGDAAAAANGMTQRQYDQTRADQRGYRERGDAAANQLQYLLGLEGATPGNALTRENLLGVGNSMNQELYDSNADYRSAWDAIDAEHRAAFGRGFTGSSDMEAVRGDLARRLGPQLEQARLQREQQRMARDNGDGAFGSLSRRFGMADFKTDPGYAFRQAEGLKGVNNSAAARGGLLSGAALKAASKFNSDFASNEYGNAYNRFTNDQNNTYNRLAGIAGTGQTATNFVGQAGANMATQVGNNLMGAGNARASGYVGMANAVNGAIGTGFNAYQNNQLMSTLAANNAWSGGGSTSGGSMDPYGSSWGR